ncbi:hypothetical protein ACOME3_003787 [Neoechinorhynchus agilis]
MRSILLLLITLSVNVICYQMTDKMVKLRKPRSIIADSTDAVDIGLRSTTTSATTTTKKANIEKVVDDQEDDEDTDSSFENAVPPMWAMILLVGTPILIIPIVFAYFYYDKIWKESKRLLSLKRKAEAKEEEPSSDYESASE